MYSAPEALQRGRAARAGAEAAGCVSGARQGGASATAGWKHVLRRAWRAAPPPASRLTKRRRPPGSAAPPSCCAARAAPAPARVGGGGAGGGCPSSGAGADASIALQPCAVPTPPAPTPAPSPAVRALEFETSVCRRASVVLRSRLTARENASSPPSPPSPPLPPSPPSLPCLSAEGPSPLLQTAVRARSLQHMRCRGHAMRGNGWRSRRGSASKLPATHLLGAATSMSASAAASCAASQAAPSPSSDSWRRVKAREPTRRSRRAAARKAWLRTAASGGSSCSGGGSCREQAAAAGQHQQAAGMVRWQRQQRLTVLACRAAGRSLRAQAAGAQGAAGSALRRTHSKVAVAAAASAGQRSPACGCLPARLAARDPPTHPAHPPSRAVKKASRKGMRQPHTSMLSVAQHGWGMCAGHDDRVWASGHWPLLPHHASASCRRLVMLHSAPPPRHPPGPSRTHSRRWWPAGA